jgi:hypothetical protein
MNKIVTSVGSSLGQPDRLPIAVRAYATPPLPTDDEGPKKKRQGELAPASEWTLIFDTETTVDAAQRLRIGAYQFRNRDELDEGGLFYDPAIISEEELSLLRRVAAERGLRLRSVPEFIDDVLFARAYDLRASIVGFNLPFDISRLAIRHGSARGKAMRGGFTFKLSALWAGDPGPPSECPRLADPVHAPSEAAGPSWTAQAKNCAPRSARLIH